MILEFSKALKKFCNLEENGDNVHFNKAFVSFIKFQQDDLNNSNIKSQEKLQNILTMIKIYEALISFRIGAWSVNCTETAHSIKNLFKGYINLVGFTKVIKISFIIKWM